ncbi:MAG: UDP-N-acetylmuramate:L-alanyl-gamma-D-glutamyl-meso-diaminopimelate ligase, partial [Deltaproteobacteria bacterium]
MSDKNLVKNCIPENVNRIHLIAICGTGMGALAGMLKDRGFRISGSDRKIYPPMSDFLARKGISVADGFSPENVSDGPDLVVIGNAVSRDNPEVMETMRQGLNFCSMPQAVNHFGVADNRTLLIAGTHGKSTTSSILTWILYQAGQQDEKFDPSYFIGGILKNFNSNYRLGKGSYMVIEGDEYDTAFFDKRSKFLHYDPLVAVLTSVEFDHADIFRDLDHVKKAFDRFLSRLSPQSRLLVFDGDENIDRLVRGKRCDVNSYGMKPGSTWHLKQFSVHPPWTSFEVYRQGR